jgi:hypothetical protein
LHYSKNKKSIFAMSNNSDLIPDPPVFTEEEIKKCRETGDFIPILFEWYKFVASLGTVISHILPESPAFKDIPKINYHITMGLLNRCCRLMLSNIALSHQGKFGETTSIIDRCIFESAVKLQWLCIDSTPEKFNRFLAGGLKTELELKAWIDNAIAQAGTAQEIETRMLRSISNHIAASGLNETQISELPNVPDMASMLQQTGHDRLMYIVAQKIGSHHVHGTWSSLLIHYLEEREAEAGRPELTTFQPRGHDCSMHINQYMFTPIIMLDTLSAYVGYTLREEDASPMKQLFDDTQQEVLNAYFASEKH